MSPQYGELRPTNGGDLLAIFGAPQLISMGFASWQRYCTTLWWWASAKLCAVEQRSPPVFGRAAIMLGIGPHSSFDFVFSGLFKRMAGKSISEMTYFMSNGM